MPKLAWLPRFERDYRKLSYALKPRVQKTLLQMEQHLRHPGLRVKRMQGTADIWEARVTGSCRMTFNWDGNVLLLRTVGEHDILKHP